MPNDVYGRTANTHVAIDTFVSPYRSFAEVMMSRDDVDKTFLIGIDADGRTEWSVRDWREAVFNLAAQLVHAGIRPGTRVAVPAVNSCEALLAIFSCWTASACCVPIEPAGGAVSEWVQDARTADCEFVATVRGAQGAIGALDLEAVGINQIVLDPSIHMPWEPGTPPGPATHALCLYSSGTTGAPKGINLSYDNLFVNFDSMKSAFGWGSADRVMTVLPISHGNGLLIGSLLPWFCGASMILCDRFSSSSFWTLVEREGATTASVVPTVLAYLDARDDQPWPTSFRGFVSGSGPLSRALAKRVADRGPEIRQIYGLSETTCVTTMTPAGFGHLLAMNLQHPLEHLVSVGPAVAHVEVAVLDRAGVEQPAGAVGELAVRGAIVMQGYHNQSTQVTDANGWFRTGDEGCWQAGADGSPWFYVTGRLKDLIIRGGLNISPLQIEDALLRHPGVDEVMAFGFPDEVLGEAIGVAIVSASGISESTVRAHAERTLERAKRPARVMMVAEIPKTRSGKILRIQFAQTLLEASN